VTAPALQRAYLALTTLDNETPQVLGTIARALDGARGPVLEVGCGYGRYLRPLGERGIEVVGVDVNPEIVRKNREAGLKSMLPEEFQASRQPARVLLMSHVIEHFQPRELLDFLDRWLDYLEPGGELVIATPLMTPHFYDDFDHVKPYHPDGLKMVFGGSAQVQYYSRHRLELVEVIFRRSPWRATLSQAIYRGGPAAWPLHLANVLAVLAFRLSFGLLGRKTGWIGRFRKLPTSR
jgi:SAM-dependent methyltransferase